MKLKENLINKRNLLIVGVAFATIITLTGCGKKDTKIKTYEKENDTIISSQVNDKTPKAGDQSNATETIKKNLKDRVKYYEQAQAEIRDNTRARFIKIKDIDGQPAYIVAINSVMVEYAELITYKDGNVIESEFIGDEYANVKVDATRNIVVLERDMAGEKYTKAYKIDNNEFIEFAYTQDDIKDCVDVTTELTNENIDRICK